MNATLSETTQQSLQCRLFLLYGEERCQNRQSYVPTNPDIQIPQHTHTVTAMFRILMYPEVPWSFPCHQSERQCQAQERNDRCVRFSSVTEKKLNTIQDRDSKNHGLFSHKYLGLWHRIPSYILVIDRHTVCSEIHNITPQCLSPTRGNYIIVMAKRC